MSALPSGLCMSLLRHGLLICVCPTVVSVLPWWSTDPCPPLLQDSGLPLFNGPGPPQLHDQGHDPGPSSLYGPDSTMCSGSRTKLAFGKCFGSHFVAGLDSESVVCSGFCSAAGKDDGWLGSGSDMGWRCLLQAGMPWTAR